LARGAVLRVDPLGDVGRIAELEKELAVLVLVTVAWIAVERVVAEDADRVIEFFNVNRVPVNNFRDGGRCAFEVRLRFSQRP
jgi:hypothetical protein